MTHKRPIVSICCSVLLLITGCVAETRPTPDVQATVDIAVQRALSTQTAATASSAETATGTPTPTTISPAPFTQIPEPTSARTIESTATPTPGYRLAINETFVQPGQALVEIANGTVYLDHGADQGGKFASGAQIRVSVTPDITGSTISWEGVDGQIGLVADLTMNGDKSVSVHITTPIPTSIPAPAPALVQNDMRSFGDAGGRGETGVFISLPTFGSGYLDARIDDRSDCYSFGLTRPGTIKVTMTPAQGSNFDIYLESPNGDIPAWSAEIGSQLDSISHQSSIVGSWLVCVSQFTGFGTYSISVDLEESEP